MLKCVIHILTLFCCDLIYNFVCYNMFLCVLARKKIHLKIYNTYIQILHPSTKKYMLHYGTYFITSTESVKQLEFYVMY